MRGVDVPLGSPCLSTPRTNINWCRARWPEPWQTAAASRSLRRVSVGSSVPAERPTSNRVGRLGEMHDGASTAWLAGRLRRPRLRPRRRGVRRRQCPMMSSLTAQSYSWQPHELGRGAFTGGSTAGRRTVSRPGGKKEETRTEGKANDRGRQRYMAHPHGRARAVPGPGRAGWQRGRAEIGTS